MERRTFIGTAGLAAAGMAITGCSDDDGRGTASGSSPRASSEWSDVRSQFELAPEWIHMSALLVSTHPRPVREAIARYRSELNGHPVRYLEDRNNSLKADVREAAAEYLGGSAGNVALTDSTTQGIALIYHGLSFDPGDEVLTTEHDYYATYEALRQANERTGVNVRRIPLYDDPAQASADEIVSRLDRAVTPKTRALALTWVHSSTGVKLPLADIAEAIERHNAERSDEERILICVDGVHGVGVENVSAVELGCDFLMSGCHKWLFGPRGTGFVWGRDDAWPRLRPIIPSFMDDASWNAWAERSDPAGPTTAERMSPGGFKPFEHQWAMADAFRFHQSIGKARVADRTHALNRQLKEGLSQMDHVSVLTPLAEDLSAGITCFNIDGRSPESVVDHFADRQIVATTTPYAVPVPRLTPSIYNTAAEVDAALDAVNDLG